MDALKQDAKSKAKSPKSLIPTLSPEMPAADRRIVSDARIRTMLLRNYQGAISLGEQSGRMDGWLDDVLSFCRPWGFDVASISSPVLLWHGEHDVFVPRGHFRWLADNIKQATAVLKPGAAHFDALPVLPHVLRWLLGEAPANRAHRFAAPSAAVPVSSGVGPVRG
jgi:pimeloyl-ACP methyl ester carboxylesterase